MFEQSPTLDAYGNALSSGDTVLLTQPLKVGGTKVTLNKGHKVKNIRLTDDPEVIEANIPEVKGLVLKTCFVKKVS